MKLLTLAMTIGLLTGQAATILFRSGDAINEYNSWTGNNVVIAPHPVWETGIGEWISVFNTGLGGAVLADSYDDPFAIFTEVIEAQHPMDIALRVWADDTANIYLNQVLVLARAEFQDSACAAGPPGCEVGEGALVHLNVQPGSNLLDIAAFQRAGATSGIRYYGELIEQPTPRGDVPEPSTAALLIAGVVCWSVGFILKKRGRSQ